MIPSKIKGLVILYVILFLFGGCNNSKVNDHQDFSIYLVKELTTTEAMGKNLNDLPLESTPVLTDKEIKIYKWKEHGITLTEDARLEEKLEGKVPTGGKPFVVVVGGERIYLGSFWTYLSSQYNPEIPVIYSIWFKGRDEDSYTIKYGGKQDPRDDIRIYEALKELGKMMDS